MTSAFLEHRDLHIVTRGLNSIQYSQCHRIISCLFLISNGHSSGETKLTIPQDNWILSSSFYQVFLSKLSPSYSIAGTLMTLKQCSSRLTLGAATSREGCPPAGLDPGPTQHLLHTSGYLWAFQPPTGHCSPGSPH